MVNPKTLIEMALRWRKAPTSARRMISSPDGGVRSRGGAALASKGYFVIYTLDGHRFVVPLVHLNSSVFRELFKLSAEEFGLPSDRPITLPCDARFMEHLVALLRRRMSEDVEKALLSSIVSRRCSAGSSSSAISQGEARNSHALLHGF